MGLFDNFVDKKNIKLFDNFLDNDTEYVEVKTGKGRHTKAQKKMKKKLGKKHKTKRISRNNNWRF